MSRPIVFFTLIYIAGILISDIVHLPDSIGMGLLGMVWLSSVWIHLKWGRNVQWIILILFFLLGLVRWNQWNENIQFQLQDIHPYISLRETIVDGTITGNPVLKENRKSYILSDVIVENEQGEKLVDGKIQLNIYTNSTNQNYFSGERVRSIGRLKIPELPRNPGAFNYRQYELGRGIIAICQVRNENDVELISNAKFSFWTNIPYYCSKIRYEIVNTNRLLIPKPYDTLVNGISLGIQSDIPEDIQHIYISGGIYHLLVVSGGNVMMVAFISFLVFRRFQMKRRISAIFTIPIILCYSLIVGFDPPVTRATIMGVLVLLGLSMQRDVQVINSLALAALIILIMNPNAIYDSSFQLSYLTVFGLAVLYPILTSLYPFKFSSAQSILYGTLSATLMISPFLAKYFHLLSPVSLITNLIAIPLICYSLPVTFITFIVYQFSPLLAQWIAGTNTLMITLLTQITGFLTKLPGAYFRIGSPSMSGMIIYYIFILGFIYGFNPYKTVPDYAFRKRLAFSFLIYLMIWVSFPAHSYFSNELKVTFLDVGQGDCMLLEFPNGKTMLIDGGGKGRVDMGKQVVLPYLYNHRIKTIDLMVVTHPDNDHAGGLISVLEEFPVKSLLITHHRNTSQTNFINLMDILEKKKIPYTEVYRFQDVDGFQPCKVEILNPLESLYSNTSDDDNNNSIVLRVHYGNYQFLLTGDIHSDIERYLVTTGIPMKSTVLKISHHGSQSSSSDEFLKSVNPDFAVIQVGRNNLFGHPSALVLERINQMGIDIYRTDLHGAIIFRTDGENMYMDTMLNPLDEFSTGI